MINFYYVSHLVYDNIVATVYSAKWVLDISEDHLINYINVYHYTIHPKLI